MCSRTSTDLTTLHQGIDLTLGLSLIEAVFGDDLSHENLVALECRRILLRKLAPLGADFLKHSLLGRVGIGRHCRGLSHQYLAITAAEWEAFLDDLQQTLDKFAVPQAEQTEIKSIVGSTRADIVV